MDRRTFLSGGALGAGIALYGHWPSRSVSAVGLDGIYNVRAYGAVGDGVNNDFAAIQAAINDASNAGGQVHFPSGVYFIGTGILTTTAIGAAKLSIRGAGKHLSRILKSAGTPTHTLDVRFTGASVVDVQDLSISGPTGLGFSNGSVGLIWITGGLAHQLRLDQVAIMGTHDHGILNSGGGHVELIDVDIESVDVCAAMFESTNTPDCADIVVRGGTWGTPNGDLSSQGSVGLYVHPHIPYNVSGVTFRKLGRYAFYQNGSPGSKRRPSVASHCQLIDCELAQTKGTGLSVFDGCSVRGTSSGLGSSLGGHVILSGCAFERAGPIGYGPIATSEVLINGSVFVNTPVFSAGGAGKKWQMVGSAFRLNDEGFALPSSQMLACIGGRTVLADSEFVDETTTFAYQTPVALSGTDPHLRLQNVGFSGGKGSLSSGVRAGAGSIQVESCRFDAGSKKEAISCVGGFPVNGLEGSNNQFLNGAYAFVSGIQQRLTRRPGVNPLPIASVADMDAGSSAMCNWDTHVVTGGAVINSLANPQGFVGQVSLIAAAGASWSTSAAGNISPLTTAPRSPNTVVTLLWVPTAGKWLEV